MDDPEYPLVVIGAGAGGLVIAIGWARAGRRVLLIERGHWGGDCTNFGCIPSKTLIAAAKQREESRAALLRVRTTVAEVRSHEEPAALQKLGIETLTASVSFLDPHVLEARDLQGKIRRIRAKKIVIATGSSPLVPPLPGLAGTPFLTNETVFNLEHAPKSLIVLGGGPIGCELAQAFQRLGSSVKLVHKHPHLLAREPAEASLVLAEQFKREGIELHLGYAAERIDYASGGFRIKLRGVDRPIEGEHFLVAVGRTSNLKDLCLEKADVTFTEDGISVDAYGRTKQKHIYVVGDALGPPFFTHLAENRARTVLASLLLSPLWKKKLDQQPIPRVTYTDPEIASVGLLANEAIEQFGKNKIAVYSIPMREVDRAITQGRTEGFVQIVTRRWSSRILGATIVCPGAGELLSEITLAMYAKLPLRKLAQLIHPYPTYSLALRRAADRWLSDTILPLLRGRRKK